jgi:hypothetical protein
MVWPFNKISGRKGPRVSGSLQAPGDAAYVSRPNIEAALASAVARGENLALYGPSHQGKTMLLARQMPSDAVVIECRPDFKRAQIYRVILSSLGYAVLVEKKRSGKASATVKLGVGAFGGEANAEGGLEQTMQPVTVDLKNSSEVALLISRIRNLPWIVLNNFQLLGSGTKRTLLFDLATFADRPGMRIMVVGSWPNEDYLEELEPALAGRFHYLEVPMWSNDELREAASQWISNAKKPCAGSGNFEEFLELAAGDISLFRALIEGSVFKSNAAGKAADGSSAPSVQEMVLGRFRRGLSTKLQAIYAERDSYAEYLALQPITRLALNPKFIPTPGLAEKDYLRTSINPETSQPYANGGEVRLDEHRNPQYIEVPGKKVVSMRIDIVRYLLRQFHAVVHKGLHKIDLVTLVQDFENYPTPGPIELEKSRLKAALLRFGEVQRGALVVPALLGADSTGKAMEIVDRRLFLYLQRIDIGDLIELLESAQPRLLPSPRRRNQISREMTEDEKTAYVVQENSTISP